MKKHILLTLATAGLLLVACGEQPAASSVAPAGSSEPATSQSSGAAEASSSAQAEVAVTVALDADSKDTISIGGQTLVVATVTGTDTKAVSWSTSNAEIATVAAGVVTGKGAGDVTITATSTADATKSASITIHIIDKTAGAKTVAELSTALANLAVDATTAEPYTVKGRVAYIETAYDATYKNVSFYVRGEDGGKLIQAYRCKADTTGDIDISGIKPNDVVYLYGKVKNYKGMLEYSIGEIVKLEAGEALQAATAIKDAKAYQPIDVKGTVIATSTKGFVVNDGEASISVYVNDSPAYADKSAVEVGDYVQVSGMVIEALGDHGYLQVTKTPELSVKKAEGTASVPAPVALTKELLDASKTAAPLTSYTLYRWTTTVGETGDATKYLTYPLEGSDVLVEASYPATALKGEKGKKYVITAAFVGYDTKYDYACVVIKSLEDWTPEATGVEITGAAFTSVNDKITLSASVAGAEGVSQDVVWSVDHPEFATIDENGRLTGVAEGDVVVTATSVRSPEVSDTHNVHINPESTAFVTGVTVDHPTADVAVGGSITLTANVEGEEGCNKSVTWSSSDATKATVDDNGKVTIAADAALAGGTVTITATTVGKNNLGQKLTDSSVITITNPYGTSTAPISVADALTLINALDDNGYTPVPMYVTGVVSKVTYAWNGENMSFEFKDADVSNKLTAYKAIPATGVAAPSQNDEVAVSGYGQKYKSGSNVTPELTKTNNREVTVDSVDRKTSTISQGDHEHATINNLAASGVNGSTQTFTVTPDSGYKVGSVTVNGKTVEPTDGVYSFVLDGNTTVAVNAIDASYIMLTKTATEIATLNSMQSCSDVSQDEAAIAARKKTEIKLDDNITLTVNTGAKDNASTPDVAEVTGGSNRDLTYWTPANPDIRIYVLKSKTTNFTIAAKTGYVIKSIKLTYGVSNSASMTEKSNAVVNVDAAQHEYVITGGSKNGNVQIRNFEIIYAPVAS